MLGVPMKAGCSPAKNWAHAGMSDLVAERALSSSLPSCERTLIRSSGAA